MASSKLFLLVFISGFVPGILSSSIQDATKDVSIPIFGTHPLSPITQDKPRNFLGISFVPLPDSPQPQQQLQCSVKGTVQIGNKCVLLESSELSWKEAHRFCNKLGLKLAEITSGNYYFNLISASQKLEFHYKSLWVGALRTNARAEFCWHTHCEKIPRFFWTVTFENGKGIQEPQHDYYKNCALLDASRSYYMNPAVCNEKHSFLCDTDLRVDRYQPVQKQSAPRPVHVGILFSGEDNLDTESETCPEGWTHRDVPGGNCYRVMNFSYSFNDAKEACEEEGAYLVAISSKQENKFVAGLIHGRNDYDSLWIGAKKTHSEFKWINGEDFFYTNWAYGEPDNQGYSACAAITVSQQQQFWESEPCTTKKTFICELPYSYE